MNKFEIFTIAASSISAVASCASVIIAIIALFYAKGQISTAKSENKKWKTLEACNVYDTDPIIYDASNSIHNARRSEEMTDPAVDLKVKSNVILNYLDGIAIGINEGIYDEDLARDHIEPILTFYTNELLKNEKVREANKLRESDYKNLIALFDKWSTQEPRYKSND